MKKTILSMLVGALACTHISFAHADGHEGHNHSHRSEVNIARDEFRKPYQTLDFFGVESDDKVVEIWPGGGWYTEVIAPMITEGQLVAAHYVETTPSKYRKRSLDNYAAKLQDNPEFYGDIELTYFDTGMEVTDVTKDADVVLVFRSLHGLQRNGDLAEAFSQFSQMLKSGGTLGIVQHQAPEGYSPVETAPKGYLPKSHVIAVAQAAGFVLDSEAYFHNNPKDRILQDNIDRGVWALPPSLSNEDMKEELKEVGESNRMTLRFKKL